MTHMPPATAREPGGSLITVYIRAHPRAAVATLRGWRMRRANGSDGWSSQRGRYPVAVVCEEPSSRTAKWFVCVMVTQMCCVLMAQVES